MSGHAMKSAFHRAIRQGDLQSVAGMLRKDCGTLVHTPDPRGLTPLMLAAMNTSGTAMLQLLLDHGADVQQQNRPFHPELGHDTALSLALAAGDPDKVALLLAHGADLKYRKPHGYNALLNAVHGRDIGRDERLLPLLKLLIARGVELNAESDYRESALRVLAHVGRFDAMKLLLDAGADSAPLRFTPLHEAVALSSLADVEACLAAGPDLEARDWWSRTPWLLALQTGDIAKAERLQQAGADTGTSGHCGEPPLFFALASRRPDMLDWLLAQGIDADSRNEFGESALHHAVALDDAGACRRLLAAGATLEAEHCGSTPLGDARSREVAQLLVDAGADTGRLTNESRRVLMGLPPDPDIDLLDAMPEQFLRARTRRFGRSNPEAIHEPFWESMIHAGVTGYAASQHFGQEALRHDAPVWCAQRFGQSTTLLPDGRIVLIGGEHEDYYDPDFCIYNDVFVLNPDGALQIYGYPEDVFPPTDGHSATLIGAHIWIIGCIGYQGTRRLGFTPVYRLDTRDWRMEKMPTTGDMPGWIYGHRATLLDENTLGVEGGTVVLPQDGGENHGSNAGLHFLDLRTRAWTKAG